ncbi:hypothetical protein ACFFGH_18470 [Lysobacter korlensis]|uniref:Uncharacterized protein n=1 Tax=Lysobacter korlensis TaxID=553636 RepID=A0ABV6RVB0_9GAMM
MDTPTPQPDPTPVLATPSAHAHPTLPDVLGWPASAPDTLRPAVLAGLARLARSYPQILAALGLQPGDFATLGTHLTAPSNPAYRYFGTFPALGMVATLGVTRADPTADRTVDAAAALLLRVWASSSCRDEEDFDSSVAGGFRSLRQWATGKGRNRAVVIPQKLTDVFAVGRDPVAEAGELSKRVLALDLPPEQYEINLYKRALAFLLGVRLPKPRGSADCSDGEDEETQTLPEESEGQAEEVQDPEEASGPPQHSDAAPLAPPARPPRTPTCPIERARRMQEAVRQGTQAFSMGLDPRIKLGLVERARRAAAHQLPIGGMELIHPVDLQRLAAWEVELSDATRAALQAALYGGQTTDDLPGIRVARGMDDVWQQAEALAPGDDPTWLLLAPLALLFPNHVNPRLAAVPGAAPASPWCLLPLAHPTEHRLTHLAQWAERRAGGRLFEPAEIKSAAQEIERAAAGRDSAVRLGRVGRLLGRELNNVTGGDLHLQYLRNRAPGTHDLPGATYEKLSVEEIARAGARALRQIDRRLGGPSMTFDPDLLPLQGYVGSQRAVDASVIAEHMRALASACAVLPRGRPTLPSIRPFHNAYTDYTAALMLAASVIRPFNAGFAALAPLGDRWLANEKPQTGQDGRVIPAMPVARAHWRHYTIHRTAVVGVLGQDPASAFFHIGEDGKARPYTPAHWKIAIAPLPDNVFRHWLPNALRRLGWGTDRRHHLMGHAGRASRPTAPYTSIPIRLTAEEAEAMDAAMTSVGLAALRGMGHG